MKEYIDLGLPSGTKWYSENEEGYYTYNEAVEQFRDNLPTKERFKELINECEWTWDNSKNGYKITGKNDNSIFLPAAGYQYNNGNVGCKGIDGYYWSSTPIGLKRTFSNLKKAFYLYFYYGDIDVHCDSNSFRQSIRLVKNK